MAEVDGVRWYFDANLLGVARGIGWLRPDTTYPGAPGCPVTRPDTDDDVWLPRVAGLGWGVIMRDKRIRRRPGELRALVDCGAVAFVLTGSGQKSKWDIATLLVHYWDRMEDALDQTAGPAMFSLTSFGVRPIMLSLR